MQNILGQGQACSVCTSKKSWFSAPKLTLCPLQPSIGVKTRSGSEVSVDVMSPPLCCRTTKYDSVKQTFWTPRQQYSSDLVWNLCHTFMMIWCGFVQTWGNPKECCFRTKTCGHHLCRETWLYQTISTYIHTYIYIYLRHAVSQSHTSGKDMIKPTAARKWRKNTWAREPFSARCQAHRANQTSVGQEVPTGLTNLWSFVGSGWSLVGLFSCLSWV